MVVSEEKIILAADKKAEKNSLLQIREEDVADLKYVERPKGGYSYIKRAGDLVIAFVALLVLLVPMLIISAAIYIDDPGKVLFRQNRIGLGGKTFELYKFRTMKESTPKYLSTAEVDDPKKYLTKLGKLLRKTSLDELPQLINVLRGDMSMVGPRPLIPSETDIHKMRTRFGVYNVRPGMTGLAQINGRDTVTPAAKVRWDVKYVENFGIKMDMKIFFSTVPNVLTR